MNRRWLGKKWGITLQSGAGHPPLFQQIIHQISFHISSGNLKPETQLPPVRKLAKDLEINFNTVSKAYHDLSRQGLIQGRKGGGSIVSRTQPHSKTQRKDIIQSLCEELIANAAVYGIDVGDLKKFFKRLKS